MSCVRNWLLDLKLRLGLHITLLRVLAGGLVAIARWQVRTLRAACVGTHPASVAVALRVITPTSEHWLIAILVPALHALAMVEKASCLAGPRRLRVLLDRLEVRCALQVRFAIRQALGLL